MKPEVIKAGAKNSTDKNYALIRCPGCKGIGSIDRDQFEGRVSMQCECGYHEIHDLREQ